MTLKALCIGSLIGQGNYPLDNLKVLAEIRDKAQEELEQTLKLREHECFWCGKTFIPTSHNWVHVGGHDDVSGCDDCLGLREAHKLCQPPNGV
uniref:C2H2-type domain-containing protein n=1 Tax=viral metagenome TaxID=1070528 RepID=A0A6M3IEW0_9ZZZZ